MNRHSLSMPRVPAILQFSKTTFMGVVYLSCTIRDDLMRAWGQAFRIPTAGRGRAQASMGMSCQPIAGYEREMFSAGCTMNIGSKKLLREVASTFCGAQVVGRGHKPCEASGARRDRQS